MAIVNMYADDLIDLEHVDILQLRQWSTEKLAARDRNATHREITRSRRRSREET